MSEFAKQKSTNSSRAVLITVLPGPDRRRTDGLYQYRLVYRQPESDAEGCLMLWHVSGGRMPYQVALERDHCGNIYWHCTCADHVYRAELEANHTCKHIRGLLEVIPPLPARAA
jgi:hypothetical protein